MCLTSWPVVLPATPRRPTTGSSPAWLVPAVLLALLAALIIGDPARVGRQKTWPRILMGIVIELRWVVIMCSPNRLVLSLPHSATAAPDPARAVMASGRGSLNAVRTFPGGAWRSNARLR